MNKKLYSVLAVLLVGVLIFACACNLDSSDGTNHEPPQDGDFVNPGDNLGGGGTGEIADEVDAGELPDGATTDLSDLSADVDYADAVVVEPTSEPVTLSSSGSYLLSGSYTGGIEISSKLTVHLFLNNADVSCNDAAAIASGKKCSVTITAVQGTTNGITTTASGVNALHVKGTLALNGSGKVTVSSADKHGVKVSGAMQVADVTMELSAANHAVACGSLTAVNADITVASAGKDGINADCDFDNSDGKTDYEYTSDEGFVSLTNCNYTATVSGDGIQAETFAYLKDSDLSVTTQGEFVSYSAQNMQEYDLEADDFRYVKSGSSYKKVASDYRGSGTMYALTQSCKGVKVGEIKYEVESDDGTVTEYTVSSDKYCLVVDGGSINIAGTDDALHVNSGNLIVNDGEITVSTFDDGLTCDLLLRVNGGSINVTDSYEGLEGAYVEIVGGRINVNSSDDGINAASDDASIVEHIIIKDGEVVVYADGDGLDSNGSILIAGGSVTVYGPTSGADGGLDADRGIVVTGGTLVATSTLGMVETPSSNSTQYVVSYANRTSFASGTVLSVIDSDGNEVLNVTLQKSCQSVIFSCAAFQNGGQYTIKCNDEQAATFTVSGIITSVGSSSQGGFGGGGFGGGGRPGGRG